MGMFDHVRHEEPCPTCGEPLTGWQSKDGDCLLEEVEPLDCVEFYTICWKCDLFVERSQKRSPLPRAKSIDDFKLNTRRFRRG